MAHPRITIEPDKLAGAACIRGLRIPVSLIVDLVADGMGPREILEQYPDLEAEDIPAALKYAADAVRGRRRPNKTRPS